MAAAAPPPSRRPAPLKGMESKEKGKNTATHVNKSWQRYIYESNLLSVEPQPKKIHAIKLTKPKIILIILNKNKIDGKINLSRNAAWIFGSINHRNRQIKVRTYCGQRLLAFDMNWNLVIIWSQCDELCQRHLLSLIVNKVWRCFISRKMKFIHCSYRRQNSIWICLNRMK